LSKIRRSIYLKREAIASLFLFVISAREIPPTVCKSNIDSIILLYEIKKTHF
tara:strand:+ start:1387 stop:1542 length:156 start_codon:yes stop_codon:yes gene_type:complete